ncbi:MAG: hypothetical protein HY868_22330 [Chloroflexi bacterium]|nr:hypothetical protein [Chloroflexota bacterium]
MWVRQLPPYTREIFKRIGDRIQALFLREDNLARLRSVIVAFLLMLFLLWGVISPSWDILDSLAKGIEIDFGRISINFGDALVKGSERFLLAGIAIMGAVNSGITALHIIYGMASGDSKARIRAHFALAQRPLLNIRDGTCGPEYKNHPLNLVGGPGMVNISSNTTVVTEKNGAFRRVLGPGDHLLENFERILAVVDLRPQCVTRQTSTQTKDGVPILAQGEIEFRILPGDARPTWILSWWSLLQRAALEWCSILLRLVRLTGYSNRLESAIPQLVPVKPTSANPLRPPYPFLDRFVVRAVYGQSVSRITSGETRPGIWSDSIPGMAMGELGAALSDLTLDRITEPEDAPQDRSLNYTDTPRWKIQTQVLSNLAAKARQLGCVPLRFSLGRVSLDPNHIAPELRQQIEEQRNRTWRAEWERRAQLLAGATEAEVNRLREIVRSQAQAQMIRAILQGLPAGADVNTLRRMMVLRMIEVLERIRQTPQSQQFYPAQAVALLEALRRLLT